MILKTQFTPQSMWPFARFELVLGAGSSVAAWVLIDQADLHQLGMPAVLATVLGTALSILLAVRVNTAYQRWWEASAVWAQIVALSRNLIRVAVAVSSSKTGVEPSTVAAFQRDMGRRQVAFANALRIALRGGNPDQLTSWLTPDEQVALANADNRPALLLQRQSQRIFQAYGEGVLSGLDNFQMEVALAGLAQQQALAERVAMQPVPRTYDVFSRYLVHLYVVIFPFAVIGSLLHDAWLIIPATLLVAFAFRMIERIGGLVERPFGASIQDVPLTAICTVIERDLLEQLGETDRPAAPEPVDGYLW